MKKIIACLLVLLTLVGCAQEKGYSQISDGNDVIFEGPNNYTYTKQDLYKSLKVSSIEAIELDILNRIAETLDLDMTTIENEADEMVDMYISMGYESLIISYYGSVDAFKESYIQSGVMSLLAEYYVNVNYDRFVADDKPVKMQIVSFYEQETAEKLIADVNGGMSFEEAAEANGYEYDCPVQVYLDSDETIPLNVKSYINETASNGISSVILVTNSTTDSEGNLVENNTYYVLNIVSRKAEEFKEEYISEKAAGVSEDTLKNYMFSNHEIKFYDQDIYEMMYKEYEVLQ